jgi:sulfur-carrier protein adenylyltransferase/sulfurtransferase
VAVFEPDDLLRYSRHLTLAEIGVEGQQRLAGARVLLVGAGGLGSPAGLYLAAAGIGTLGIVDADQVDLSNLQRQVLHGTSGIGRPKTDSARDRLADLNPGVDLVLHRLRLTAANALDILAPYDLVLDGSDNFPTRYLVNDACAILGRPYVYGSILRFEGQVSLFDAASGPCYRCLFAEPPPADLVPGCAEAGVLGVLPGIIGSLMALEAMKWVLGAGEPLIGRMLLFDALRSRFREVSIRKDPECPVCGENPTVRELIDYDAFCGVDGAAYESGDISPAELRGALFREDGPQLLDVREPYEWEIARITGSRLLPLGELPVRLNELDPKREVVAYCHHGTRSQRAAALLRSAGFRARSLAGGIDAWSAEVDPAVRRY